MPIWERIERELVPSWERIGRELAELEVECPLPRVTREIAEAYAAALIGTSMAQMSVWTLEAVWIAYQARARELTQ